MELVKYLRDKHDRQVVSRHIDEKGCEVVRFSRGKIIGVVVSNGYNSVGWSIVHPDDDVLDVPINLTYAKELARKVETKITSNQEFVQVPHSIKDEVNKMLDRSKRYFK